MDPRHGSVAVVGAGVSGLITAYTLLQDGFTDVQILTRDAQVGGVWSSTRIYPGLHLNNVHGEYALSPLQMPSAAEGASDPRLSGDDLCAYTKTFAEQFLQGKIQFGVEVVGLRRPTTGKGWLVDVVRDGSAKETREYARVVLCTGGCNTGAIPDSLTPAAAATAGFKGMVFHSASFGEKAGELLRSVPVAASEDPSEPAPIVVVGGGKSAQDVCAYLANEGREVTIICPNFDAFTAGPKPLPDFIRKSRLLSLFSPHIHLRTSLERFLHTTWAGKKIVDFMWNGLSDSSFQAASIPADSPLRNTVNPFWNPRVNDEAIPRQNAFHALAVSGKIGMISPARVKAFGTDGRSVVLDDGRSIAASALILATGYQSSWPSFMDEQTLEEVGVAAQPVDASSEPFEWKYTTLQNPPPLHPEATRWFSPVYRGIVPTKQIAARDIALNGAVISANFGYTNEVTAHWISSYFLGDDMRLPATPAEARAETERAAAWLCVRYPEVPTALNGSHTSYLAFWSWPQHVDDLLEDMRLPVMRSGGNWLTWPFQVVSLDEIRTLKEERAARRAVSYVH